MEEWTRARTGLCLQIVGNSAAPTTTTANSTTVLVVIDVFVIELLCMYVGL